MFYLTYNDSPSGIYNSQVIDVVKNFNTIQNSKKVKLIALISIRTFFEDRKKIKTLLPESLVLPMFPTAALWKWNFITLFFVCLFSSRKKIMARGAFATCLALRLKKIGLIKKVIFDGRGAYWAELNEYSVVQNKNVVDQIKEIEKRALLESDHRLAVSNALVNYWKAEYNYNSNDHIVVPCTLSDNFIFDLPTEQQLKENKKLLGYNENDIVIVYSGSSAAWQSFDLVDDLLLSIFEKNANVKLLMLTHPVNKNSKVYKAFENRIKTLWVNPEEVRDYLIGCDYGIMFRQNTITNKVASPVKFGEYLSCGLKVIISNDLGDFTKFSEANSLRGDSENINSVSYIEKLRIHQLAMKELRKENFKAEYLKLLDC